jgi:hypothetical protein
MFKYIRDVQATLGCLTNSAYAGTGGASAGGASAADASPNDAGAIAGANGVPSELVRA